MPGQYSRAAVLPYNAALDGVRAISIIGIMANHSGLGFANGGYISVNVFFVLSGYLITSLLAKEWLASTTISLKQFWARRARRLLPALFVLLVGIAAYAWLIAAPQDRGTIRGDGIATLFYAANWHQIATAQSYFVQTGAPSPLLHTWTLAIEEQFYLVWPIVVLLLLKRFRTLWSPLVLAVAGSVASAVEMALLFHPGSDPSRLYYGTDTRAQDLLVGAAVALGLMLWRRRVAERQSAVPRAVPDPGEGEAALAEEVREDAAGHSPRFWTLVALVGAVGFGVEWSRLTASSSFPYLGGFLLCDLLVGLVIAGCIGAPRGLFARVLGFRPLAAVGRISYGLYLWHWPIFLALDGERTGLSGWSLFGVRSAVSLAAAIVSAYVVENPIRRGALREWRAKVATPAAAVAAGVAVIVGTVTPAAALSPSSNLDKTVPSAQLAGRLQAAGAYSGHPVRFMMLGDSMAVTLVVGLGARDATWGVDLNWQHTELGCDLDPNLQIVVSGNQGPATPGCKDWQHVWPQLVTSARPEVVGLLLGRWEVVDHLWHGKWVSILDPAYAAHLRSEFDQAVSILSARGATVVLMTEPYVDPPYSPDGVPYPENSIQRTDAYNALVRVVARDNPGRAVVFDLNALLCPSGRFQMDVDGIPVRWSDGIHISPQGGEFLQPAIYGFVDNLALDERAAHARAATR